MAPGRRSGSSREVAGGPGVHPSAFDCFSGWRFGAALPLWRSAEPNKGIEGLIALFSGRQVTLFEQRNFAGRRLDLTSDCTRLSDKNFPDRCNSAQVESGA